MALTAKQLAQHVAPVFDRNRTAVLAYAWPQSWTEGEHLDVNGRNVAVERCESVLAVREALARAAGEPKILLVAAPENELGQDVLARIYKHELLHVDRWQMVKDVFETQQIDPRLYELPWMADALLDIPRPRVNVGGLVVLTYERAVELCVSPLFGCSTDQFELEDVLAGCDQAASVWIALPQERKAAYTKFLMSKWGKVAEAILGAIAAGQGHATVAIGLACEVLYSERLRTVTELRDSRVRLEAYLGGHRLAEDQGKLWAQAAERDLRRRSVDDQRVLFHVAMELLQAIGAERYAEVSGVLPAALDARLDQLGSAIQKFLKKPEHLQGVEDAASWVAEHRRFHDHPGRRAAQMAVALCRREATYSSGAFSDPVADYVQHGAWEDYARRTLRAVRPDVFARAVTLLIERVIVRRSQVEQKFATQLSEALGKSGLPAGVLPVEHALDQLVAPLAEQMPVVMLVLDGMSWDVYYGLAEGLTGQGWESRGFEASPVSLLATVPSVTECSRTSLLSGRLARGTSSAEKPAFAAHPGLSKASRNGKPPVLLHKAELATEAQLSDTAARLLADSEQQVIGIVINAVDDALCKSDQVRLDWSVESIPLLSAILAQARLGSRAVFITSDHGHVLEVGSQYKATGGAERWRSADSPVSDGEIQIGGARVRTLMSAEVIVPWSEKIRYAAKKNGYHGGVSRQEMLVPFGLWVPAPNLAPTYPVRPLRFPEWWDGSVAQLPSLATTAHRPGKKLAREPIHPDLFSPPPTTAAGTLLNALLASPVLARQRERIGRVALEDDRLLRLLGFLEKRGGRATLQQLATAIEQPTLRMRGIISALQRMLNVDGYAVVTMEAATSTVILNAELLSKQFLDL